MLLLFDFCSCCCCTRLALGWADVPATPKQQIAIIINNLFIRFAFTDYLGHLPHLHLHGSLQCTRYAVGTDGVHFCDIEAAAAAQSTELITHAVGKLSVL